MTNLENRKKIADHSTKSYIKRIIVIQGIFLVVICFWIFLFATLALNNHQDNLKNVALEKVYDAMSETVDNMVVHIDAVRSRIQNEADIYLADLSERMKKRKTDNINEIAFEIEVVDKNTLGNLVQVIYESSDGNIYYINADDKKIITLTSEEKTKYLETESVKNSLELDGKEINFFIYQAKLDELVQAEIYNYIHMQKHKGNKYVWVNEVLNMDGGTNYAIRKIHPNLKEEEGQYLSTDMEDIKGNLPYKDELEGIRENGYIFHSYYFKNLLNDDIEEKYSYAVYFEPFHWIIATGETLEETYGYSMGLNDDNVNRIMALMITFIGLLIIFSVFMIYVLIKQGKLYREQLKKQSEIYEDIYATLSVGLIRVQIKGNKMKLIKINPEALALFGVDSEAEFIQKGKRFIDSRVNTEYKQVENRIQELKEQKDYVVTEQEVIWKDGSKHLLQFHHSLIELDGKGKIIQHTCQDITEERRMQEEAISQAEEKATLDPMTQLKNKKAMETIIGEQIEKATENNLPIAVGFVDVDNFRDYNTRYGHLQGDNVIKHVASVLKENIEGDVGRIGGDEFAFCVLGACYDEIEKAMKRIHQKLNAGLQVLETGNLLPTPCSIGVVIEQSAGMDYETLMKGSDEAMYQAKEKGKNTYFILQK